MESFFQSDLEEAKTQENTRLKSALQEMQLQFDETKELLKKEREAAKQLAEKAPVVIAEKAEKAPEVIAVKAEKAPEVISEKAPVIQEVSVVDNETVNKLTAENEQLKVQ